MMVIHLLSLQTVFKEFQGICFDSRSFNIYPFGEKLTGLKWSCLNGQVRVKVFFIREISILVLSTYAMGLYSKFNAA